MIKLQSSACNPNLNGQSHYSFFSIWLDNKYAGCRKGHSWNTRCPVLPLPVSESKIGSTDLYPAFPVIQVFTTDYFAFGWALRISVNAHHGREKSITGLQHLMTHKPHCFSRLKPSTPSKGTGCCYKLWTAKIVLFKTKGRTLFIKSRTIQTGSICKSLLLHTSTLLCFQSFHIAMSFV